MNFKSIVEFLLPELQIFEIIKQRGFIAKNEEKNSNPYKHTIKSNKNRTFLSEYNRNSNPYKHTIKSNKNHTFLSEYNRISTNQNQTSENRFIGIEDELKKTIIGQDEFINNLCIAFKRPFIAGYDNIKPKNTIFIFGGQSSGKALGVTAITTILANKKVLNNHKVSKIDLSRYSLNTHHDIFLSDLYKALYEMSDVILFENFEKCHSRIINILTNLVQNGFYLMEKRYASQNEVLIEATGALIQNSIDTINANSKFFIFISEKKSTSIADIFGNKFILNISDIISLNSFEKVDLEKITKNLINEFSAKCVNNLRLYVSLSSETILKLVDSFNAKTGMAGIIKHIDTNIYKPLAEYKIKHTINNSNIKIDVSNDNFICNIDGNTINLSSIIENKNVSGLDEVKSELNNIVGLSNVKEYILSLEDNLQIQEMREKSGFKTAKISMHMIFTGNPGTGKTTIARIAAKYLKALGVLSSGQLREVTRNDLVGQYVGHTAKITSDVIKSALGGVLFIDEAYSLSRGTSDLFGIEAIDTLVKAMEDYRDDLVVILAGYEDEMRDFLKTNSGLKSRFPNIIEFKNYSSQEMYQISLIIAKSNGYIINDDCKEPLIELYDKKQIKGKNDSGNGRLARNIIESTILRQSKRLLKDKIAPTNILSVEDFDFEDYQAFNLEENLSKIIGLENVKDFIRTQHKLLIARKKRQKAGIYVDITQSLNMIFTGNPGTGKTTMARIVAKMLKEMGFLKSGHLVETDKGGLVSGYVGQTAKKTEDVFKSALGGVLFIDEAYSLSNSDSFSKEAIDTLVKLIEDFRGEIVVILAGYKQEMKGFLKSNSGLLSRFPLNIEFLDYSPEELYKITISMIKSKGFILDANCEHILFEQIVSLHKQSNAHSGNGRMIRNYLENIIRIQSTRIASEDIPDHKMNLIISEDIIPKIPQNTAYNLEDELSNIIGLDKVKNHIRSLSAKLRLEKERKKMGLPTNASAALHMIFKGNPGTGKTMAARTIANVLYNTGVIKTSKLVETDRGGLVAGYVGQTAIKTKEVIWEAMDGVLFIDEAYSLAQGGENDFGKEAIDTLVKMMDDNRDRLVVILAGYNNDMDRFLSINAGLKSRFPNIVEFKDYSIDELLQIAESLFKSKGYILDNKAFDKLKAILAQAKLEPQFGNGRYVRNIFEKSINNQALRLSTDNDLTKEELTTILDSDIERM
ncbi:MAG: AAA family ATPase [Campylobacteraceae bacterium]|jgi:SpoVK/Ycf46/Vps4 family AAA+-type ATPase|nr:AAA family ATPase [Campylobacteraceae bacterium]